MQARLAAEQRVAQYQADTLPRSVKPTPPENFKGQMDGDTV